MDQAELDRILLAGAVGGRLDEPAAKRVLAASGIGVPRGSVFATADGLDQALAGLRYPLAAKLVSPGAIHKSDIGGVRLNLSTPQAVATAISALDAVAREHSLEVSGFLVEEMASGHELVIGAVMDPRFGPVLMLGLGGVFVEVLGDVAFRVCPLDRIDAVQMIDELKGVALLRGARGGVRASQAALIDALLAVGGEHGLVMRLGARLSELDINPLIVDAERAVACDARLVLRHD